MGKPPLVEVEWIDSCFNPGWHKNDTYSEPSRCRTVGYLTHKGKDCLNISMNVTDQDRGETMAIPRVCVKSIRKLRHRP